MTPQPGKQTIAMHVLPTISRRKSNQAMKFGQLIEYKMRNTFLKKSYAKCGGETVPIFFSKKSKLSTFLNQESKLLHSLPVLYSFIVCQVEGYQNILKLNCRPVAFTLYKAFLKSKKKSRAVSLVHFLLYY